MSDGAMDLALLPALELRRLIDDGDVSAHEVAAACLARIKAADPPIQSFVTLVDEERVMVAAETAQKQIRQGAALPLAGIPYALKDLTETAGIRTTFGSRLRKNYVPNEDAAVARRLREAGGVLLGKTNTPEFGNRATTALDFSRRRTIRGTSSRQLAAPAAARPPLSLLACVRSPKDQMAEAQFGFLRVAAASSGSSHRAAASPTRPTRIRVAGSSRTVRLRGPLLTLP